MNDTTDATAILGPIWRRKWLILAVAILVAAGTYFYYKRKPSVYQSTTQVYLAAGSEQQLASEKVTRKGASTSAATQATIINTIVVESAKKRLRKEHNAVAKAAARGKVKAKAAEKSEFVTITAEAHKAKASALLANTIATLFIKRQRVNYEQGISQAIAIARRQLHRLETPRVTATPKSKSSATTTTTTPANGKEPAKGAASETSTSSVLQAANLSSKINQLEAQLAVNSVQQVKPAQGKGAVLLSPKPRKSAIFGFVLGLVLASIAAFGLSRFNRRLRSLADIESVLQTKILTALPKVKRPIVHRNGQPRPSRFLIEPLRRFHTTLEMGNVGLEHRAPRSILIISADLGDGKSTVAANLALVQREAGERAAVFEADFRRPVQSKLLDVPAQRGLAQVLSGVASMGEAMQTVPSSQTQAAVEADHGPGGGVATALATDSAGSVSVLVGDTSVPNPPVLLASGAMTALLRSGIEDFDHVIIDAPPPLEVSDVMPLLGAVDAIVIVARVGHTREASAQRLQQLLASTPSAPVLGVVANGAARADMRKYGIAAGDYGSGWPARLIKR